MSDITTPMERIGEYPSSRDRELLYSVITILAEWELRAWTPKELHLSTEDWWIVRDAMRDTMKETSHAFFNERLQTRLKNTNIVANPFFAKGNFRFEPMLVPAEVRRMMQVPLEEFRDAIKP